MWSRSRTRRVCRTASTVLILGAVLAGCSDIYYDRRETIALGADDHIATNEVEQMIDPWPPHVGKRNIAFNGQKMQSAVERYRTNRVIPPVDISSSSVGYQQAPPAAAPTTDQATPSAPAAPAK